MRDEPYVAVDPDAETAPYQQIFEQLRAAIERRALAPGEVLPTVRQLAADLGVAPNTVARAYSDLQAGGLIRSDGRRGTRVTDGSRALTARVRNKTLQEAVTRFVATLSQRGYSRGEIGAALDRILAGS
jgi:DNA-binding transcriptional regulator YhcF (GntR family)